MITISIWTELNSQSTEGYAIEVKGESMNGDDNNRVRNSVIGSRRHYTKIKRNIRTLSWCARVSREKQCP